MIRCCFMFFNRIQCRREVKWRVFWEEPGKAPYDCYTEACSQHVGFLLPEEALSGSIKIT